jgi:hypothetical protein
MRLPRMTIHQWMITIAIIALAFGAEREWQRWKGQRISPAYRLASAIVTQRDAKRTPSPPRTGDSSLVVVLTGAALVGSSLRRRHRQNPRAA